MKIPSYLSTYLLFLSMLTLVTGMSQEMQEVSILEADASWGKEVIKFPVAWAPKMTMEGFEELRFAPGWSDITSEQFWTYILAWNIKTKNPLTPTEIETNLENYFDGLMKPNHWAISFPEPLVLFVKNEKQRTRKYFIGKMKYFDGFHTGKVITTNIKAEQFFCNQTNRTIVIFRISPKELDHPVWDTLATIKRKPTSCESK
jgi:hypothetical protein